MIPVLGVPVLNRWDLADRMIRSVDVPVGELLVVVNGHRDEAAGYDWGEKRIDCQHNLGVPASWNMIIRARPSAPWWLIVNADIQFAPGDLERLTDFMDTTDGPVVGCLFEFGAFGINQACVDEVGWFDENYYPIYAEDTDYRERCRRLHVPVVELPSHTGHDNSSTIHSDPKLFKRNRTTHPNNTTYFRNKWGQRRDFATPFAKHPMDYWRLDRRRLVDNAWEVEY